MKANEYRGMSQEELGKKIGELKGELFNLRFQHATNQLENPMRIVEIRKDIARAKTILREFERRQA